MQKNNNDGGSLQSKLRNYIPVVLLIVVALILARYFKISPVLVFLQKYERLGVAGFLLIYVILGVTPIPTEPVGLLFLAWKGPVPAILLATVGNTLAAIVEYYIGGSVGDLTNFEQKKETLPFHLGRLPINSPAFLILGRMLPGFGPKFVSIACGIYKVPMFTYLWTALVAHFVGATILMLGGNEIIKRLMGRN